MIFVVLIALMRKNEGISFGTATAAPIPMQLEPFGVVVGVSSADRKKSLASGF